MTTIDSLSKLGLTEIGATPSTGSQSQAAERFLKMLVAQMQNQDPLNPMDNAQVTSQMAQINAVSGLEQVNQSVKDLGPQLLQLQAVQGAALVGRGVTLPGSRLAVTDGTGRGAFELAAAAGSVKIEALDAGDRVVGSVDLGAQGAGRHDFEVPLPDHTDDEGLRFRIVASSAGQLVGAKSLMIDRVTSVATTGGQLLLTLQRNGSMSADAVVAFN